jgi:hypothetical protein
VTAVPPRRHDLLAFLLFLLLPMALLGECVLGGRAYLPFDIAEFPPLANTLTVEQREALRATANYDATEAPIWFASELQLARQALAAGHLPHWNGYVRGGAPMLAHGHLGLLNPLHWPALLCADPADGLLVLTYTMFALAGALMYGLLRALQLGPMAAAFGGIAFAWSGTLGANGHWFMRMEPLALLPGLLWAMVAIAARTGRARAWPALGMAAAMAAVWLSGFPQYGIPVTLLAAGAGVLLCGQRLRQGGLRSALRLAGWFALGGGLGLLAAMPQLLPMLHFYPLSNRPIDESFDRASRHAWAPMGWLGYLFPALFSHPGDTTMPTEAAPLPWLLSDLRHWDTGARLLPNYNFTEYAIYPGTLPLWLAALALLQRGPRWRFAAAAGFVLVWWLATGALGAQLAYLLPGIKTVPPYRFAGAAAPLLAMLAAAGFDALTKQARPWLLRTFAVVLAAAGAFAVAESTRPAPGPTTADDPWLRSIVEQYRAPYAAQHGVPPEAVTPDTARRMQFSASDPRDPEHPHDTIRRGHERLRDSLHGGGIALLLAAGFLFVVSLRGRGAALAGWPAWLALVVTAAELGTHAFTLNRGQPLPHAHDSPVHAFLRERRDAEASRGGFLVTRGAGAHGPWHLPGGTLAADHIRDLNFYTFVDNKSDLPIRRLYGDAQILRGFVCSALPDDERLRLPWWDLMGVRYVLATTPMQHAGARVGPEHRGPGGETFVYERPHALPRAWVVPALRIVDGDAATVDALVAPELDPRAAVLVGADDAARLGALPVAAAARERAVAFVHEDGKRLVLRVDAGAPGYLVLADTFFPGWSATIDGADVPIARGNLYQRVVALPATGCEVHFRFRAQGFVTGLALGAAALLGAFGLLFVGWRARRVAPPMPAVSG